MNANTMASIVGSPPTNPVPNGSDGVVELGLLLPTKRAAALMKLARDRHESVGQVLRKLIERELSEAI